MNSNNYKSIKDKLYNSVVLNKKIVIKKQKIKILIGHDMFKRY